MALFSFTDHPASVGETYLEHLASAWGFAGAMLLGSIACAIHGVFPFLLTVTGSSTIRRLHDRMVANRLRAGGTPESAGFIGAGI